MSYQKQAFMEYLHDVKGNANPGAYCNGLDNIEKLLKADIDAEYLADECSKLYDKLQQLRKLPENAGKNEHNLRQYASRLKQYIGFRQWQASAKVDAAPSTGAEPATATWVPFYTALADEILAFKENRSDLLTRLQKVFQNIGIKSPFMERDVPMSDVDPFTIFGCFNKGITNANRIKILRGFQKEFSIHAEIPSDFDGIPVLNNLMAVFFAFKNDSRRKPDDIENLWKLFEVAIEYADAPSDERKERFIAFFDKVRGQFAIRWNITMGLFWIRPYCYLNLDDRNRQYLKMGQAFPPVDMMVADKAKQVPSGADYLWIIEECKKAMASGGSSVKNFVQLSQKAWIATTSEPTPNIPEPNDDKFWPSLDEYNPNLSKEDWKTYLTEIEIPDHPEPMKMLRAMMEHDGLISCKKLSQIYGGTPNRYIGCTMNLGRRAKKHFGLPACMDDGQERFFAIPFQGMRMADGDFSAYVYRIRPELKAALSELDLSIFDPYYHEEVDSNMVTDISLNTILYGPPGTGKTYHTVAYAVAIIENKPLATVEAEDHDVVLSRYNAYKAQGRIEFTTFHQSYGYEEFIEGIKPVVNSSSGNVEYSVEDGVFKAFCSRAQMPQHTEIDFDAKVWKVVLESGELVSNNPTKFECFNTGAVTFDWNTPEEHIGTYDFHKIEHFRDRINVGDIVLSYAGGSTDVDAIGIVTGSAEYDENKLSHRWSRSVRWLNWIDPHHPINLKELNGNKYFDNDSLQQLKRINISDLVHLLAPTSYAEKKNNFVFIIDEINRGNISKIFGELITLIESSKRSGRPESLAALLPYSQQAFSVPENVYIIGTMNTADRSIATIDTALRRRFMFREMLPDPEVLDGITVEGLSIRDMLDRMNQRIAVLYDREHTIGHAYFMPLKKSSTIEVLAEIFRNNIIPLLQEYFYEDYEKIRLVLADNRKSEEEQQFIIAKANDYAALFGNADIGLDDGCSYEINPAAFTNIEAYKLI